MGYPPLRRLLIAGVLTFLIPLCDATGQEAPRKSEIRGLVLRSADRTPVSDARVSLEGTGMSLRTDRNGRFKFPKVAAGKYLVRAETEGSPVATITVIVKEDDRLEVEFLLDPPVGAQVLPQVEVTAPEGISPIAVFNRRAQEGNGRYFTRADIEKRNAASLMDLLRGVPGVRIDCGRNLHQCAIRLRRATCDPAYYLNGLPSHPSVLFLTAPNEIEGIEIYTGAAETPIELEGGRAGCGAVVIWTRVGKITPPR